MIGIVHCGAGNIASVATAVEHLGGEAGIIESPDELDGCDRIILPGVGSFLDVMQRLRDRGFESALQRNVASLRKPALGICLGMQLMADRGTEGGDCHGLGWFDASVLRMEPRQNSERIPHVGWNQIQVLRPHPLLAGVPQGADFYFVHSYAMRPADEGDIVAVCDFAGGFTAIVARDNVFATQFHPEKSQDHGLKILENFLDWNP